jgi:hypothetical protein
MFSFGDAAGISHPAAMQVFAAAGKGDTEAVFTDIVSGL